MEPEAEPPDDERGDATLWLLNKRRVTAAMARGDEPAWCCKHCATSFEKGCLPDTALANDNWIGRNHPVLRDAHDGTKMVIPIARACHETRGWCAAEQDTMAPHGKTQCEVR